METETIDRLFLELSQVTRATTAREIELERMLVQAQSQRDQFRAKLSAAEAARDAAVALLIRWQRWNDGDDTGLPIEERDMTFDDDTRTFLAHGGFA